MVFGLVDQLVDPPDPLHRLSHVAGLPGEGQHGLFTDASFTASNTKPDLACGGVTHNAPAGISRLHCVLETGTEVSQMTPICDPDCDPVRPWLQPAFSGIPSDSVAMTGLATRLQSATRRRTVVSPK